MNDLPDNEAALSTVIANTPFIQTLAALAVDGAVPEPAFMTLTKAFADAWTHWEVRDSVHTAMLERVALGKLRVFIEDGQLFSENIRALAETPDICKQPGMESSRFDLLEFRHNGFEARLQGIESDLRDPMNLATVDCLDGINEGLQAQIDRLNVKVKALEFEAAKQGGKGLSA